MLLALKGCLGNRTKKQTKGLKQHVGKMHLRCKQTIRRSDSDVMKVSMKTDMQCLIFLNLILLVVWPSFVILVKM